MLKPIRGKLIHCLHPFMNALPYGAVQRYKERQQSRDFPGEVVAFEKLMRRVERNEEVEITLLGKKMCVPDFASFYSAYKAIFLSEHFKFETESNEPVIIDLGSNVGVSIVYFKKLFPKAIVHAVEADPKIFRYLVGNLKSMGIDDVVTMNRAAWISDEKLRFVPDGADGGRIETDATSRCVLTVEGMETSAFLNRFENIELLKMDIEGAEGTVLPTCEKVLRKIKRVAVEYHSDSREKQDLDKIIQLLARNGFRINIKAPLCKQFPFLPVSPVDRYDNQLDIFAYRT